MFYDSGALAGPLQVKYEGTAYEKKHFKTLENRQIKTGLLRIT